MKITFGLTIREKLIKLVQRACWDERKRYFLSISTLCKNYADSLIPESEFEAATKDYLDAVANTVILLSRQASPVIWMRLERVLSQPSLCGYPDINTERMMAGSVYAVCFWAIKKKSAVSKDCVFLNHFQNAVMDDVIQELERQ